MVILVMKHSMERSFFSLVSRRFSAHGAGCGGISALHCGVFVDCSEIAVKYMSREQTVIVGA